MKTKNKSNNSNSSSVSDGTPDDGDKTENSDASKEIIIVDSGEEVVEIDDEVKSAAKAKEKEKAKPKPTSDAIRKHYLNNALLRGLLPRENEDSFPSIENYPNILKYIKKCCIEHCYFARNRLGTFRYNLRSCSSANEASNTLPFENSNEVEQQTIDFECLGSAETNSESTNESINGNIKVNGKKKTKKRSSVSISSGSSGVTEGSVADDTNDKDYCPVKGSAGADSENLSSAASVESCKASKRVSSGSGTNSGKPYVKVLRNVLADDRKKNVSRHRVEIKSYPVTDKTPNNFVSVHDLITKFKNMQKLMRAKCERRLSGVAGKTSKMPPIKVKKVAMARGKGEDFPSHEYLYPIANLSKMAEGDKNWRVEYMDDDVQSFGLDDLLLKASELNAENFTKALGRKMDSVNSGDFNAKDSSEIVFTIPKPKRNSVEEKQNENGEGEFSSHQNLKTIKLDISKPFFESSSGEGKEPEKSKESTSKPSEESSPKRPGIKVKTVENINEEFKDALSYKNKLLQESGLTGTGKEVIPPILERKILASNCFNKRLLEKMEKEANMNREDQEKKDAEESRPFIMTIIQSKSEKQRPAILRNSSYFRKKLNNMEIVRNMEKAAAEASKKEGQKTDSNSGNSMGSGKGDDSGKVPPESQVGSPKTVNRNESFPPIPFLARNFGNSSYSKTVEEGDEEAKKGMDVDRFAVKKRNIPFILSHTRKTRGQESCQGNTVANAQVVATSPSKLVKVNEAGERLLGSEKTFKVTSIEQKVGPKEVHRRFIKVVPYEPVKQLGKKVEMVGKVGSSGGDNSITELHPQQQQRQVEEELEKHMAKEGKSGHVLSLSAFATILKDILPDKWFLFHDKKYGLQIVKTHIDDLLNPSILISVVIARCGKVTVNVRGRQLPKSHALFSNLCDISNSENKLSLNYVLALLNKLNYLSVCYGCDDQSLKKYWCKDGFIEHQTEFQQVYRSQLCQMLVSLGKKRCYPCYRMNESLKKRYRREKLGEKSKEDAPKESTNNSKRIVEVEEGESGSSKATLTTRGVKRNLEDFLEESFSTMKQQIADEIEKNKKLGERENALKAQEEVLSFMGLTRKDSLDNSVRKSKRKKTTFYSLQQPVKKKIDQQELEFLEKHWADINTLFSTSLLFGAYSRTGRSRLREKCRMFQKLLSTWRNIARTNPEWIGGEITLPEELFDSGDPLADNSGFDQFEKMEVPALRTYIINSVKEVNRIKHKLRTRNSYFKILYNKFVKRRMKRPKLLSQSSSSSSSCSSSSKKAVSTPTTPTTPTTTTTTTTTPTPTTATASSTNATTPASSANNATSNPTDLSSDESNRDKEKMMAEDENRPVNDLIMTCVPDGD